MTKRFLRAAVIAGAVLFVPAVSQAAYVGTPPLLVINGGTGAITFTAHGVLLGETAGPIVATAVGTNGQMFLGATAGDPGWQTMSGDGALGTTGGLTLATVNSNVGTFTLTTLTVNGKGLITAASTGTAAAPTVATVTGSGATQTFATTNLLTEISNVTVAAVWSLPVIQAAGWRECVKDGTTNFATNNVTVKPNPTSLTIDGIAGTTGIVLNQNRQEACFISDATNWWVE